ncbi:MAG: S-methyl-5-thioribose-1-phosphate isomerase [Gemmatimonadaceae bacterium]|nr:S-methyl-5-thioribose-1-phosphate isomerase [Gemmatimonadaceae bacterium]
MLPVPAVAWSPDRRALRYLDQRALPAREVVRDARALDEVIDAIRTLAIRGAPAIGVGAAIGLVVALMHATDGDVRVMRTLLPGYATRLSASRPTAVNLGWAVGRMVSRAALASDHALLNALQDEADAILREDIAMCEAIGQHGLALIPDGARVLTHCNAGALATAGIGTALAPIYAAHALGRRVHVYADETRPLRQGARLTAWEMQRAGIAVTVLPDSAAAALMAAGMIDLVIVGADRIAANGDVANKIGTYGVALAAQAHGVPVYVAAPWSTVDAATAHGGIIEIEHRSADELGELPSGVHVWNPAFDVTPRALITGYLTDRGRVEPPFRSI